MKEIGIGVTDMIPFCCMLSDLERGKTGVY